MKKMNSNKGITLIALIITIIILIILAGVSINLVFKEDGIIDKAKTASEKYKLEAAKEKIELAIATMRMENPNEQLNMKKIINELPKNLKGLVWSEDVNENTEEPYGIYKSSEFYINRSYDIVMLGLNDDVNTDVDTGSDKEDDKEEEQVKIYSYIQDNLQVYLDAKEENVIENNIWKDISGNQNNATLNGCTLEDGKVTFDGIDDWASLGEENHGEITLEVIFEVSELSNEIKSILGNYQTGGYGISLDANNIISTSTYINGSYLYLKNSNSIEANTKYKVTLTSNGKQTRLYINGNLIIEENIDNGLIEVPAWNTRLALGTNPEKNISKGEHFKGSIYLARLYDRVLSENEIKENYNYDNNKFNINSNYFENIQIENNIYKIASVDDLVEFRDKVNAGDSFKGKYVELESNLNLSEITSWTPIGTTTTPFKGTFNGNGHDIENLNIDNSTAIQGLFGKNEGIIEGINIKSGTVKGTYQIAAIVGNNSGNIINCSNAATIAGTSYYVGGICGWNTGNIQKCYNTGNCSANSTSLGGISGRSDGLVKFCYNTAAISSTSYNVGGIVGIAYDGTISSCYNTGSVTATGYSSSYNSFAAGILGQAVLSTNSGNPVLITDCYNVASVTGTGGITGGIAGYTAGTIQYSYNTGTIIAKRGNANNNAYAGGIVGSSEGNPSKILYCYNIGTVTCTSGTKYPGGIVGYNVSTGTVINCYTLSTVISTTIGNNKGTATNTTSKTMAQMKAADFINSLGATTRWQVVSGNYPKLYWE